MTEEKKQPEIKVYSTPTCPYCVTLKAYLDEHNFAYQDIDVGSDTQAAQEMIDKTGQMGVPVTEINGEIIIGFDKPRINKLLGIEE